MYTTIFILEDVSTVFTFQNRIKDHYNFEGTRCDEEEQIMVVYISRNEESISS